jgi:uncharacterized protein YndB with AHSA1/START domain
VLDGDVEVCGMIGRLVTKEAKMAPIRESIEIDRRPEDVFAYVVEPSHLAEWQDSLVSAHHVGDAPVAVGSRLVMTRKVGRGERTMTMEMTELNPPRNWTAKGIDGPIRATVRGTVEPLGEGERSRVTMELEFDGHGIGKLLIPLVVRRQARSEMPANELKLKHVLESRAQDALPEEAPDSSSHKPL